jgi:hypothetical protein
MPEILLLESNIFRISSGIFLNQDAWTSILHKYSFNFATGKLTAEKEIVVGIHFQAII